jgi:transposase
VAMKTAVASKRAPSNPSSRWLISDELWSELQPLLPPPAKREFSKGGRPCVPERKAMNGILLVLRTGCQWKALNATGICSSSTAHLRFQEWVKAGVFHQLWAKGLNKYDELRGIQWRWQSMDGALTKAPLGGEKNRSQSHRPSQKRCKTPPAV